ncbi:carbohydrate-binding module family 12 protein [Botryobasidium botryosum FD-172 SS1]|uniref:Carbohydrate-binding module family 12 protein n=1 Tax=Botryobasidium botryosum (strain FD-172 SS1) TaxID=930990 RepID=A0A067N0B5_BOTB1|nr:carbohydrate-binding module family 12 protein [Botryobasidium botryosum FD-172 SS1]
MVQCWEPGTQYDYGSVVEYCGAEYKIIQPHRSQGDWTPDVTPALWGRMQGHHGGHHGEHHQGGGGGYGGQNYQQPQQQPPQQPQQPQYNYGGGGVANPGPPTPAAQPTQDEKKTNWYDLDDERKKQLEIGGGLLAGAALLGGGFAAFQHHKKGQEQDKAEAWAVSNWLQDAKQRTANFNAHGPQGPTTWVLVQGTSIPRGAIEGGREKDGTPLYIARCYYEGGIHLGKAGRHFTKGAVIGYGGKEIEIDTYEVLLGDPNRVKWVTVSSSGYNTNNVVEGGKEKDGTPLQISQAFYKDGVHPGKYNSGFGGACIAYGGKEVIVKEFQVLVYQ